MRVAAGNCVDIWKNAVIRCMCIIISWVRVRSNFVNIVKLFKLFRDSSNNK